MSDWADERATDILALLARSHAHFKESVDHLAAQLRLAEAEGAERACKEIEEKFRGGGPLRRHLPTDKSGATGLESGAKKEETLS